MKHFLKRKKKSKNSMDSSLMIASKELKRFKLSNFILNILTECISLKLMNIFIKALLF